MALMLELALALCTTRESFWCVFVLLVLRSFGANVEHATLSLGRSYSTFVSALYTHCACVCVCCNGRHGSWQPPLALWFTEKWSHYSNTCTLERK